MEASTYQRIDGSLGMLIGLEADRANKWTLAEIKKTEIIA